jgi:hypothetical protein
VKIIFGLVSGEAVTLILSNEVSTTEMATRFAEALARQEAYLLETAGDGSTTVINMRNVERIEIQSGASTPPLAPR